MAKASNPSKLKLCAVYILSFFATSLWILSQHQDVHHRRGSRHRTPLEGRRHNNMLGTKGKRQMPAVLPGDFDGLELLSYGDQPYQFGPWDNAPIVIESHKLLFWTTPKVACTVWKKLFRRMEGYSDWQVENDNLPHSPYTNGLNYLYHYKPAQADLMLTDPSWTRAIFVREPKERLLSAYLDKVVGNHSYYLRKHCCKVTTMQEILQCDLFHRKHCCKVTTIEEILQCDVFHRIPSPSPSLRDPAVSFTEFLGPVYKECVDPHWRPQAKRMPAKYWSYINFVGHLDHGVEKDAQRLLTQIGAWDDYGANGWPSGSIFANNHAHHATAAKDNVVHYYTPELERVAETLHKIDYMHPKLGFRNESVGT